MKNLTKCLFGLLILIGGLMPQNLTAQGVDCVKFEPGESGSEAGVIVCDDVVIVYSTRQLSGACSGSPTGCMDGYPLNP